MIGFCGYNFCMDKDAMNPMPTNVKDIEKITIKNAIYDYIDFQRGTIQPYDTKKPTWNIYTVLNCDFTDGIGAGNVDFTLSQLSSIKIKRRKYIPVEDIPYVIDEYSDDLQWVTIREIPIYNKADLAKIIKDYLVPSDETFEYAIVPILNGVEGDYIKQSVTTDFNGIFIVDTTNNFKLDKNVSYGNRSSVQEIGQLTPLGRKYPIVIKNGEADYDTGSVTAILLGKNYDKTHIINRKEVVEQTNEFIKFLKNDKPKILKDWNGNIEIVRIIGNPSISYNNNYGMGVVNVTFEWIEQGRYNNEDDLYQNGFIEMDI